MFTAFGHAQESKRALTDEHAAELSALQPKIDDAIERGIRWLLTDQHRDGAWTNHRDVFPTGQTALTAYTLLKCGVRPQHAAIQRAIHNFTEHRPQMVYTLGCHLLALSVADDVTRDAHRGHIEELLDDLLDWQNGSWSYPTKHPSLHTHRDLSITQFAALAMRAAVACGFEVPTSALRDAFDATLDYQEPFSGDYKEKPSAGFRYYGATGTSGSMTTAGIAASRIFADLLGRRLDRAREKALAESQAAALQWLEARYTVDANPSGARSWLYYYLYGLERIGSLRETEYLGEHPWYLDGAKFLVKDQRDDGRWRLRPPKTPRPGHAEGSAASAQADTCFALLFLKRATRAQVRTGDKGAVDRLTIDTPEESKVGLRALGGVDGSPLRLWLAWIGDANRPAGDPFPQIRRVEYRVDGEPVRTIEVEGTPRPGESFLHQHPFAHAGSHTVSAHVWIGAEDDPEPQTWESPVVTLDVTGVLEPWMLDLARPFARSMMPKARYRRAEASSSGAAHYAAALAFDQDEHTSWRWQNGDAAPWIRFKTSRSVRAPRLRLTQAVGQPMWRDSVARIRSVELIWNGGRKVPNQRVDLDEDVLAPTWVDVPAEAQPVRELELRVLETTAPDGMGHGGLAEILLERAR